MKPNIDEVHDKCLNYETKEIFLHKLVNSSDDSDDVDINLSSTFIKNLSILDYKSTGILVHMNRISGGSWSDFLSIYDAIITAKSFISMVVYGHVCSAGSLILQAADLRAAMPSSYMMCHFGTESIDDSYLNFHSYSAFSKKSNDFMINLYADRLSKSPFIKSKKPKNKDQYIKNFLNSKLKNDWYLDSEEMLYYGMVDYIVGSDLLPSIDKLR